MLTQASFATGGAFEFFDVSSKFAWPVKVSISIIVIHFDWIVLIRAIYQIRLFYCVGQLFLMQIRTQMDRSLRHSLNGVRIEWLDAEFNALDASRFQQSPSSNAMPPIFSGQRLLAYALVEPKYASLHIPEFLRVRRYSEYTVYCNAFINLQHQIRLRDGSASCGT